MNDLNYQIEYLKAKNKKLEYKDHIYDVIVEHFEHAFLYISFDNNEVQTIGPFGDFFDFEINKPDELMIMCEAIDNTKADSFRDALYPENYGKESSSFEVFNNNTKRWIRFNTKVMSRKDGELIEKFIDISDITKERLKKDEIFHLAYYDSLTGLYNRTYFVERLNGFIDRAKEKNDKVALLSIDIDNFKRVNDLVGMAGGDEFLIKFGGFLKNFKNDRVIICHLSNDIFSIAIYNPIGDYSVEHYRNIILHMLENPVKLSSGQEISVTVSMSVAMYPDAAITPLELISCSEIVMYKCKSLGKSQFKYFDSEIMTEFLNNLELEKELNNAISKNNFVVYFQPQYHSGTKILRGMEALVRWKDPEKGLISPGVFIPLAEKNGSIISIGKFVLEESIKSYAKWQKEYGVDFIMSINISALQYKSEDFVPSVIEIINKYNVKPKYIELEITESVLIDDFITVTDKLIALRNMGIKISLDDFGTGYSSLSYLKKFPIDTLKIDKSFIDTVLSDNSTRIITETILNMARCMGFESIAEGVENADQFSYLENAGCDVIQGFFLGRPSPPENIEKLLDDINKLA